MKTSGGLVCFGLNRQGPCNVPRDLGPVVAVAAGDQHTCAVKVSGELVCFGRNDHGQCDVPPDLGPVVAVAAGWQHTCAVTVSGQLVCFGEKGKGLCGVPSDSQVQLPCLRREACLCPIRKRDSKLCSVSTIWSPPLTLRKRKAQPSWLSRRRPGSSTTSALDGSHAVEDARGPATHVLHACRAAAVQPLTRGVQEGF